MKIYTCLVGDLFHAGHVNFLKQARELGDYLLVGICSDEDCQLYKRRTICSINERATVIQACRYVNEIILSPPSIITNDFLDEHQIDLLVHGDDSNLDQLKHFYAAAINRGIYLSIPYTKGISTSEILNRIKVRSDQELDRRKFLS